MKIPTMEELQDIRLKTAAWISKGFNIDGPIQEVSEQEFLSKGMPKMFFKLEDSVRGEFYVVIAYERGKLKTK